jgi:hypothetical protein
MEIHIEDTQQFFSKTQKTKFRDALKKLLNDNQVSLSERQTALDKLFKAVHFASPERSYVSCSLVEETQTLFRVHFRTQEQEDERRKELAMKLKHRKQEMNHVPDPLWNMYHNLKNHTKFLPTPPEVQANREMFSYLQTTMGEKSPVGSYFGMCLE